MEVARNDAGNLIMIDMIRGVSPIGEGVKVGCPSAVVSRFLG